MLPSVAARRSIQVFFFFFFFFFGRALSADESAVGLLQPVTSLCHHVRYVLIEFKDLDVFQRGSLNGLCVGVPFPEMYYCFTGLWISMEAEGQGLKFAASYRKEGRVRLQFRF